MSYICLLFLLGDSWRGVFQEANYTGNSPEFEDKFVHRNKPIARIDSLSKNTGSPVGIYRSIIHKDQFGKLAGKPGRRILIYTNAGVF